jgi:hypothetical protein
MTNAPPAGVVVDTMVISWLFDERPNQLAERYRDLIGPAPARGADRFTARRLNGSPLCPTAR